MIWVTQKISNQFKKIVKKFGCPDIFINSSYPITKNWKNINYNNLNYFHFLKILEIHLNSFVLSANEIAKLMIKNKVKGKYNYSKFNLWCFRSRQQSL